MSVAPARGCLSGKEATLTKTLSTAEDKGRSYCSDLFAFSEGSVILPKSFNGKFTSVTNSHPGKGTRLTMESKGESVKS